ncbi:MAG: 3-hydroxyacyl-CoA dehydrogenase NAD-binding domain-containing protein [Planctomycetota bacterium]|nr:3-hydroxyacyl-CoA dehydrogenase NAD-binding domain-containing protein [Planctomycetota bacterium]
MSADPTISPQAPASDAALRNVAQLKDRNQRASGVASGTVPREIRAVGVIGAGVMGVGIAAAHLKHLVPVTVVDAAADALARATPAILEEAANDVALPAPDPQRFEELAALLRSGSGHEPLAACDLVIESVVENAAVKQQIYQRLESRLGPAAILASNTSTLPISNLARVLQHPERFCGLHFCNPVRSRLLVEVIRGQQTSDETIATAVQHLKRIGKLPIVVQDGPGFLVNRLLSPYLNEALQLLCGGVSIEDLDRAAVAFGMPLGPMAILDLIGIDTAFYAGRTMWEAFPDRIAVTPVLPTFMKAGRLGQKTGRGFYSYPDGLHQPQPDPAAVRLFEPYVRRRQSYSQEEITRRLLLPFLLEATRVLEDALLSDVRDVDLGMLFGLGFPAAKGGLLFWADTLGAATIVEMLQPFQKLGTRFRPTALLLEMARESRKFYEGFPC